MSAVGQGKRDKEPEEYDKVEQHSNFWLARVRHVALGNGAGIALKMHWKTRNGTKIKVRHDRETPEIAGIQR